MNDREYGELEARVRAVEAEVNRLREWKHSLPQELMSAIQYEFLELKTVVMAQKPGSSNVTRRDVYMACLGGGVVISAWKFVAWAIPMLTGPR